MPNTHCLPSGALGTAELPCPNVGPGNVVTLTPAGAKRGVVVMFDGLAIVAEAVPSPLTGNYLTFAQSLQSDGWVVLHPNYAENEAQLPLATTSLFNDVNADAGHGSRYLAQMLRWWDHIGAYISVTYGAWPTVPFGMSWGGWHAVKVAQAKRSTIIAYGAHEPVTVLSTLPASFTNPVDFTAISTAGLDVASSDLNAANVPGIIGWGTNDTIVGSTNPQALFNAANTAGMPVTSNATTDTHTITAGDVTTYQTWFTNTVDPLAPAVH